MTARTYADDLLAGFTETAQKHLSRDTPCENCETCERQAFLRVGGPFGTLRRAANRCETRHVPEAARDADSQTFAGVRNPSNGLQSEQPREVSQDSHLSQGYLATNALGAHAASGERRFCLSSADADRCHWPLWSDAEIAAFVGRVNVFIRRGTFATDAHDLAERLTLRDRDGDDRVSCVECAHYRPGRCGNHKQAALLSHELGCDLAVLLQRCPGFGTNAVN
jgi:hypothetical protein